MSKITEFYNGDTCEGKSLEDILGRDDEYLEYGHDWVQWVFPLQEPSNFNPDAPLLTDDDIQIFKSNPVIQNNLFISFIRFLEFLGLNYRLTSSGEHLIAETPEFEPILFKMPNHNWFRISRVLKSLCLLGQKHEAMVFYKYLKKLHEEKGWVSENSFTYWMEAISC